MSKRYCLCTKIFLFRDDDELAALAEFAFTGQMQAVALGNLLRDGQAKAGALPVCLSPAAAELCKDMGQFLRRDTAALVGHAELPALGRDFLRNSDGSFFRRKFYGVIQ